MDLETAAGKAKIFEYDSYQSALKHLISDRKSRGLACSYRWMAKQAGYTSPNFFKLVVDGDRELTADGADKVIQMFRLSLTEGDYFRTLVQFQRAKDVAAKVRLASELVRLRPRTSVHVLKREQFEYHRNWWTVVLREILTLSPRFRSADEILSRVRFSFGREQVERGLKHLESLQMIRRNEEGEYQVTEQNTKTQDRVVNSALFQFHLDMLEQAKKALSRYSAREREFHALTVRLSPEAYEVVRRKISELKAEILELSDASPSAEQVLQVQLQIFPVAKMKEENQK